MIIKIQKTHLGDKMDIKNILKQALDTTGIILLVAGGIIYTLGACFYGIGRKCKYMHSVFHLCVFIASLLHFLCIILYVI